ncbi:unnamed protein product, partial [marine sediment metagenome]
DNEVTEMPFGVEQVDENLVSIEIKVVALLR